MDTSEKVPLKRAEVSVRRFNELAIPHHLSLLKNHKSNIEKSLALGDWAKIKKEEINAMRVIKQVKNLLLEMDALRAKIREEDLNKFDEMMSAGKNKAFEGMKEYLELQLKAPTTRLQDEDGDDILRSPIEFGSAVAQRDTLLQIQTDFHAQEHQIAARQACLNELENLQREIQDLHGIFHEVNGLVQEQAVSVQLIADNADEALEQIQIGESNLRRALTYKKAMYPVFGALLGTCVGGPIGMVAGLKAGGLAALGCGILGFTGGAVLKSNDGVLQQGAIEEEYEFDKKKE